ncbi:nocturnin-like [Bolinopsis microptera]|uniref:nocturnin-like n=1 Tax=Bolinopsis microptera TaxID=2820187 RepID=UPI00307AE58D
MIATSTAPSEPPAKEMTVFGHHAAIRSLHTMKPTFNESYLLLTRQFEGRVEPKKEGQVFRVMQWNMLAQGLTASNARKNFCKTPPRWLEWETRRYLLLMEILSYMPDVIILQECDRFEFFDVKLREFGYKGKFHERPFSPCVDVTDDDEGKPDGCAIFYHTERFNLVEFVQRQLVNQMQHSTSTLAFALKLEFVEDNQPLLVVNTHLKGGPKTEQTRYEACIDLSNFIAEHSGPQEIVILGADLCESPSQRGYDHLIAKFKDAYSFALEGKHPSFTTWRLRPTGEEKYTNDYIFYDDVKLRVLQALATPPDSTVGEYKLPNRFCGSDHISLVCDFQRIMASD